jgi:hypothetical protein
VIDGHRDRRDWCTRRADRPMSGTASALAAVVVAAVLLVAAITKLAAPAAWLAQAAGLGVPRLVAMPVPAIEAVLGAWLLVQWQRPVAAIAAGTLVAAFTVLLAVRLAQGRRPPCSCFGVLSARPIGAVDLVRNAALLALLVVAAS